MILINVSRDYFKKSCNQVKNEKGSEVNLTPLPDNKNERFMHSFYLEEKTEPIYWPVPLSCSFLASGNPMY